MKRESLHRLKDLVDQLEDRDVELKRDASLLESAFSNFPVPVAAWIADTNGACRARKISDRVSANWDDSTQKEPDAIVDMYKCQELKNALDTHFKQALEGKEISFMCNSDDMCVWTRLIPKNESGICVGVMGLSWDVTSSHEMISSMNNNDDVSNSTSSNLHTTENESANPNIAVKKE